MKIVECRGSSRQMGEQYGETAREEIEFAFELWQPWFKKHPIRPFFVRETEASLERFAPEVLTELRGIAAGSNTPSEFILFLNFVDTFGPEIDRCTPLLLRHSPDGSVVAKNNDAGIEEKFPFIIRRGVPEKGLPFIQVTYAGWISGLDMMNAEGLANTHGSVGSVFPRKGQRIDIRLRLYELMKTCRKLDELISGLQETQVPLTGKGFSIAAADRDGECAFLDAAVPVVMERSRNCEFSWSANLYETPGLENADARIPARKPFLRSRSRFIAEKPIPADLAELKGILSDHSAPNAPCHHGDPVSGDITVWSMYCLPEKGRVGVADGNPCTAAFRELEI